MAQGGARQAVLATPLTRSLTAGIRQVGKTNEPEGASNGLRAPSPFGSNVPLAPQPVPVGRMEG